MPYVTLLDASTKEDVVKGLISDGLLMVENRREKRLQKLVSVQMLSVIIIDTSVLSIYVS